MKKIILISIILIGYSISSAYEKKSIVERFTNYQCGPCASINNSWYNATIDDLKSTDAITHVVYNVNWPGPNDPMYLLNSADNNVRRSYYGVNAVPWIVVNGTTIPTNQSSLTNSVATGNSEFSPFKIDMKAYRYASDSLKVRIKITRDINDNTTFNNVKLKIAVTEKRVVAPGGLEAYYYNSTRKMLPDAAGSTLTIPQPGEFIEYDFAYQPTSAFLQNVNLDSLSAVAFIQDDATKMIYQSEEIDFITNQVYAFFQNSEPIGASPLTVSFDDLSFATDTTSIIAWAWDFDNDGVIDSYDPNPEWTYNDEQSYSVSLTVTDGIDTSTRVMNDLVTVLGSTSDILVVNGLHFPSFGQIMTNFYRSSAVIGDNLVDVWDLFGDQGFDYSSVNTQIQQVNLIKSKIPVSIFKLYKKVIWIGNNSNGDLALFDPDRVLEYVQWKGNFLLASPFGSKFLTGDLKAYCDIVASTGDLNITTLVSMDDSLQSMPSVLSNSSANFMKLGASSPAETFFVDTTFPGWSAGFRIQKPDEGVFIYVAGRAYRFDTTISYQNYNYIIKNYMTASPPVGVEDEVTAVTNFELYQNYPNPFNPSTKIKYQIPAAGNVSLKVFDVLGREVASLINEEKPAGAYEVDFNASSLSSGIYFYTIKSNSFVSTKKMLLIK